MTLRALWEKVGREVQDGGHMYTMADSCQCMAKNHHNIVK